MEPAININAKESEYLFIKKSQIKNSGLGLFTAITIYKDEIISIYKGELLSEKEADLRASKGNNSYFIKMIDGSILDSKNTKCFAKYANDPKGLVKSDLKVNANICLNEKGEVCLVARKIINQGEEIFCSYGKKYWVDHKKRINNYKD